MGVTLTCARCGVKWTIMAGTPGWLDEAKAEHRGELTLLQGRDVCGECAQREGGFCSACMCKPCIRRAHCPEQTP